MAKFPAQVRQELLRSGWKLVQVPGEILTAPVTLNQLYRCAKEFRTKFWSSWHGDFTDGDFAKEGIGSFPLPAGEFAWYPDDPLIPNSTKKNFVEQEKVVTEFSRQVQERFGDGVEAIFPTAEHAILVLFDHRRRTGVYIFQVLYTRTVNRFGSGWLDVGDFDVGGVSVEGWHPEFRVWFLGVLRLVVPRN